MTRDQWIKYVSIIERKDLQFTHQQKVNIINKLIDKEREEWDQIELENMGLKKKVARSEKSTDNI